MEWSKDAAMNRMVQAAKPLNGVYFFAASR